MKDYVGVRCPRCGGQLDMLVEPDTVSFTNIRGPSHALVQVPHVAVLWKVSMIEHDCDKPNMNGNSFVNEAGG